LFVISGEEFFFDNRLGFHTAISAIKNATYGDPFSSNFVGVNPFHKEIILNPEIRNNSPNPKKKKKKTKNVKIKR